MWVRRVRKERTTTRRAGGIPSDGTTFGPLVVPAVREKIIMTLGK